MINLQVVTHYQNAYCSICDMIRRTISQLSILIPLFFVHLSARRKGKLLYGPLFIFDLFFLFSLFSQLFPFLCIFISIYFGATWTIPSIPTRTRLTVLARTFTPLFGPISSQSLLFPPPHILTTIKDSLKKNLQDKCATTIGHAPTNTTISFINDFYYFSVDY